MIGVKEMCRKLRNKGFTLGEIIKATGLAKTTIYYHIKDIPLPVEVKKRIREENTKKINEFNRKRKGKCVKYFKGREVLKSQYWSYELIFLTSHFMFDGQIKWDRCEYYNRSNYLIKKMKRTMQKLFDLNSKIYHRDFGVKQLRYYRVELGRYMKQKATELLDYIKTTSLIEKKIFLRAFFDDEGSVCFEKKRNKRRVRGYQHNLEILKLVQKLLKDFDTESKIDEKYKEIVISKKPNLIKFRDKINFSKGVYINPNRKNSIWKKKLEKREILDYIINSYIK